MIPAPTKPWEMSLNSSAGSSILPKIETIVPAPSIQPTIIQPSLPPPLNPRIVANISSGNIGPPTYGNGNYGAMPYNSYGTSYGNSYGTSYGGYSGFGGGGYGGYGGTSYGGYGGGYGMNNFGCGGFNSPYSSLNQPENRFIQLAEESSRPTFQSIESVVRTFGSMAMMLDQTFFAMTSSFRAVLSVADSFGRLRSMMQHMWSSFALFKAINWLFRKLMSLLRIYDAKKLEEANLNSAFKSAASTPEQMTNSPSKWPVAVFLGVIISAPYIISKMIGSSLSTTPTVNEDANILFRKIRPTYGYTARQSHELSFSAGEMLSIYPDDIQQKNGLVRSGWVLAKNSQGKKGVVPVNYLIPKSTNNSTDSTTPISSLEAVN